MKIIFVRVGIDTGCGKCLGPLFPNSTFEYIPIPEGASVFPEKALFYKDIKCRNSKHTLNHYVHSGYSYWPMHLDPEFKTFTYGDPTKNKRRQMLRLVAGDILVFYAGLRPPKQKVGGSVYMIGYFTVDSVYHAQDVKFGDKWPPADAKGLYWNAHFIRKYPENGLVVVKGRPETSRLLHKAVLLSDEKQYILPEMHNRLGLKGSLKRAIGRWVTEELTYDVKRWIYEQA